MVTCIKMQSRFSTSWEFDVEIWRSFLLAVPRRAAGMHTGGWLVKCLCRFALSAALHILCSWGPLILQVSCYMHLCHWELFSITFVMQENLILFQPVKLLQKFLPSSSGFPFFRALDKTVSSLSLQNCTDCNELTNRISGGSCWDKQTLLNLWLIIVM